MIENKKFYLFVLFRLFCYFFVFFALEWTQNGHKAVLTASHNKRNKYKIPCRYASKRVRVQLPALLMPSHPDYALLR
jgi:hypothetical protein